MFSCFSRFLNKVSARSIHELGASIAGSYEGVKVVWLRTVVNHMYKPISVPMLFLACASRWTPRSAHQGRYESRRVTASGRRAVCCPCPAPQGWHTLAHYLFLC
jgi:hypothetical protein